MDKVVSYEDSVHVVDRSVFPRCITADILKEIKELTVREDDVWLCCFPKSGTKWCASIIYHVLSLRGLLDTKTTDKEIGMPIEINFPIESVLRDFPNARLRHHVIAEWQSPRILTSHLEVRRLPDKIFTRKPKVIYVMRNPKDSAVSMYNYQPPSCPYVLKWETVCQTYLHGEFAFGPWWDHVRGYWGHRNEDNFLILSYENMKQDPASAVQKISNHLGVTLTDNEVRGVVEATSFESMKKRAVNTPLHRHFRTGQVGNWKNYFTVAQSEAYDAKVERFCQETGITFQF
ncbi:bile salt sulfotransferase-like [Acanthaster planci]|uniref:Bile salt sulfotransferase-like n=1 Tax=Acanthaster planci TaxID=133434 RepID=A0A8B7ZNR7_ACAPL|nr:bile salt sulfotransferase-like [Acanthaster planci]